MTARDSHDDPLETKAGLFRRAAGAARRAVGGGVILTVNGRRWDPALHPRDSRGRFIETGGTADIQTVGANGLPATRSGKIVKIVPNRGVEVEFDDTGEHRVFKTSQLTMKKRPNGDEPVQDEQSDESRAKVAAEDERRAADPNRGDGVNEPDFGDRDRDGVPDQVDSAPDDATVRARTSPRSRPLFGRKKPPQQAETPAPAAEPRRYPADNEDAQREVKRVTDGVDDTEASLKNDRELIDAVKPLLDEARRIVQDDTVPVAARSSRAYDKLKVARRERNRLVDEQTNRRAETPERREAARREHRRLSGIIDNTERQAADLGVGDKAAPYIAEARRALGPEDEYRLDATAGRRSGKESQAAGHINDAGRVIRQAAYDAGVEGYVRDDTPVGTPVRRPEDNHSIGVLTGNTRTVQHPEGEYLEREYQHGPGGRYTSWGMHLATSNRPYTASDGTTLGIDPTKGQASTPSARPDTRDAERAGETPTPAVQGAAAGSPLDQLIANAREFPGLQGRALNTARQAKAEADAGNTARSQELADLARRDIAQDKYRQARASADRDAALEELVDAESSIMARKNPAPTFTAEEAAAYSRNVGKKNGLGDGWFTEDIKKSSADGALYGKLSGAPAKTKAMVGKLTDDPNPRRNGKVLHTPDGKHYAVRSEKDAKATVTKLLNGQDVPEYNPGPGKPNPYKRNTTAAPADPAADAPRSVPAPRPDPRREAAALHEARSKKIAGIDEDIAGDDELQTAVAADLAEARPVHGRQPLVHQRNADRAVDRAQEKIDAIQARREQEKSSSSSGPRGGREQDDSAGSETSRSSAEAAQWGDLAARTGAIADRRTSRATGGDTSQDADEDTKRRSSAAAALRERVQAAVERQGVDDDVTQGATALLDAYLDAEGSGDGNRADQALGRAAAQLTNLEQEHRDRGLLDDGEEESRGRDVRGDSDPAYAGDQAAVVGEPDPSGAAGVRGDAGEPGTSADRVADRSGDPAGGAGGGDADGDADASGDGEGDAGGRGDQGAPADAGADGADRSGRSGEPGGEDQAGRDGGVAPLARRFPDAPKYRPTSQDDLAPTKRTKDDLGDGRRIAIERARARGNIEALRTLRTLQDEDRAATPEEQKKLARWAGWGSLSEQMFSDPDDHPRDQEKQTAAAKHAKAFAAERAALAELLSPDEILAARRNTLNAHYTDADIVKSTWEGLRKLGFDGGQVLEPGSGSGNFMGFAPDDARMVGIELDPTTAAISRYLYPDATVIQAGIEDVSLPGDTFDAAIGNVPFSSVRMFDPAFSPNLELNLHNLSIVKALNQTRPGGLVALLTSSYTMDSGDATARRMMFDKADLVGAIRMPSGAHRETAGTEVVTDLLVFRRRQPGESPGDESWVNGKVSGGSFTDPEGNPRETLVNSYWNEHPGNVLGQMGTSEDLGLRALKSKGEIVVKGDLDDLAGQISRRFDVIAAEASDAEIPDLNSKGQPVGSHSLLGAPRDKNTNPETDVARYLESESGLQEGELVHTDDGRLMVSRGGRLVDTGLSADAKKGSAAARDYKKVKALTELRDAARDLLDAERAEHAEKDGDGRLSTTPDIEAKRQHLNDLYDAFIKDQTTRKKNPDGTWRRIPHPINDGQWRLSTTYKDLDQPREDQAVSDLLVNDVIEYGVRDSGKVRRAVVDDINDDGSLSLKIIGEKVAAKQFETLPADSPLMFSVAQTRVQSPYMKPLLPAVFANDPFAGLVKALERYDPETNTAVKGAILRRRTAAASTKVTPGSVNDPVTALRATTDSGGSVDLEKVAEMMGLDRDDAREALRGHIFRDHVTGEFVPAEHYTSGLVRQKLAEARVAAAADPELEENVTALEAALPEWIDADAIDIKLGMEWIEQSEYTAFAREIFGDEKVQVSHSVLGWAVKDASHGSTTWDSGRRTGYSLLEAALNQRRVVVQVTDPETKRTEVDQDATVAANAKIKEMAAEFKDWLLRDPDRASRTLETYNDQFNSLVPRRYSDAPLNIDGMAIELRPHQGAGVRRMVGEESAVLAHEVGAGKTFTMVAGAMELRRLGLAKKPSIVVPNHMKEQWEREFLIAFPNAKVLAISSDDLETPQSRRDFLARAASGDWDAVIVTHSAFGRITMSKETQRSYLDREMALRRERLEAYKDELRKGGLTEDQIDKEPKVKETEESMLQAEQKLWAKLAKQPDGLTFEQLGIDYLMVDEAHEFKNLARMSFAQEGMEALPGSDKASDLHMKIEYLRNLNNREGGSGRVVTLATATPVSNSFGEIHTMLRYTNPDLLALTGNTHFDSFLANHANFETKMEQQSDGSWKHKVRIRSFSNAVGLMGPWLQVADVMTAEDLDLDTPDIDGGTPEMVIVPRSPWLDAYRERVKARMQAVKAYTRGMDRRGKDNQMVIDSDSAAAALHPAMVGGPENATGTKLHAVADKVAEVFEDTKHNRYIDPETGEMEAREGAFQFVFLDSGTPGAKKRFEQKIANALKREERNKDGEIIGLPTGDSKGYEAYEKLAELLVAKGIPREKIAFIHDARGDDAKKAKLFAKARSGELAVLVGSTALMGQGTNAQARAVALHDVDVPWRPSDHIQRRGRIERQGNKNSTVRLFQYATEGTQDSKRYGVVANKASLFSRLLKGKLNGNTFEEIDDGSRSFEQIEAASSGNDALVQALEVQEALLEMESLARSHAHGISSAKKRIEDHTRWIAEARETVAALEGFDPDRDEDGDSPFRYKNSLPSKLAHESRADVNAELRTLVQKAWVNGKGRTYGDPIRLGLFGGYTAEVRSVWSSGERALDITFPDLPGVSLIVTPDEIQKADLLSRLENALDRTESVLDRNRSDIPQMERVLADARKVAAKPFAHTERLEALRDRYKTLDEAKNVWQTGWTMEKLPPELRQDSDPKTAEILGELQIGMGPIEERPAPVSLSNLDGEGNVLPRTNSHLKRKRERELAEGAARKQATKAGQGKGTTNPDKGKRIGEVQTRPVGENGAVQVFENVGGHEPGSTRPNGLFTVQRDGNGWAVFPAGSDEALHRGATKDEALTWAVAKANEKPVKASAQPRPRPGSTAEVDGTPGRRGTRSTGRTAEPDPDDEPVTADPEAETPDLQVRPTDATPEAAADRIAVNPEELDGDQAPDSTADRAAPTTAGGATPASPPTAQVEVGPNFDAMTPADRARVEKLVEAEAWRTMQNPMLGGTVADVKRYVGDNDRLRALTDRYGRREVWEAVGELVEKRPELLTEDGAVAAAATRRARWNSLVEDAKVASQGGDLDEVLARLLELEAIDPDSGDGLPRSLPTLIERVRGQIAERDASAAPASGDAGAGESGGGRRSSGAGGRSGGRSGGGNGGGGRTAPTDGEPADDGESEDRVSVDPADLDREAAEAGLTPPSDLVDTTPDTPDDGADTDGLAWSADGREATTADGGLLGIQGDYGDWQVWRRVNPESATRAGGVWYGDSRDDELLERDGYLYRRDRFPVDDETFDELVADPSQHGWDGPPTDLRALANQKVGETFPGMVEDEAAGILRTREGDLFASSTGGTNPTWWVQRRVDPDAVGARQDDRGDWRDRDGNQLFPRNGGLYEPLQEELSGADLAEMLEDETRRGWTAPAPSTPSSAGGRGTSGSRAGSSGSGSRDSTSGSRAGVGAGRGQDSVPSPEDTPEPETPRDPNLSYELTEQSREMLADKAWDDAITTLEDALAANPENGVAEVLLARARSMKKRAEARARTQARREQEQPQERQEQPQATPEAAPAAVDAASPREAAGKAWDEAEQLATAGLIYSEGRDPSLAGYSYRRLNRDFIARNPDREAYTTAAEGGRDSLLDYAVARQAGDVDLPAGDLRAGDLVWMPEASQSSSYGWRRVVVSEPDVETDRPGYRPGLRRVTIEGRRGKTYDLYPDSASTFRTQVEGAVRDDGDTMPAVPGAVPLRKTWAPDDNRADRREAIDIAMADLQPLTAEQVEEAVAKHAPRSLEDLRTHRERTFGFSSLDPEAAAKEVQQIDAALAEREGRVTADPADLDKLATDAGVTPPSQVAPVAAAVGAGAAGAGSGDGWPDLAPREGVTMDMSDPRNRARLLGDAAGKAEGVRRDALRWADEHAVGVRKVLPGGPEAQGRAMADAPDDPSGTVTRDVLDARVAAMRDLAAHLESLGWDDLPTRWGEGDERVPVTDALRRFADAYDERRANPAPDPVVPEDRVERRAMLEAWRPVGSSDRQFAHDLRIRAVELAERGDLEAARRAEEDAYLFDLNPMGPMAGNIINGVAAEAHHVGRQDEAVRASNVERARNDSLQRVPKSEQGLTYHLARALRDAVRTGEPHRAGYAGDGNYYSGADERFARPFPQDGAYLVHPDGRVEWVNHWPLPSRAPARGEARVLPFADEDIAEALDEYTRPRKSGRKTPETATPSGAPMQGALDIATVDGAPSAPRPEWASGDVPYSDQTWRLRPGDTASTTSGRTTTPFPKLSDGATNRKILNDRRKVDAWLMENAIAEADSRGIRENVFAPGDDQHPITDAVREGAEAVLFDPKWLEIQPEQPFLKPFNAGRERDGGNAPEAPAARQDDQPPARQNPTLNDFTPGEPSPVLPDAGWTGQDYRTGAPDTEPKRSADGKWTVEGVMRQRPGPLGPVPARFDTAEEAAAAARQQWINAAGEQFRDDLFGMPQGVWHDRGGMRGFRVGRSAVVLTPKGETGWEAHGWREGARADAGPKGVQGPAGWDADDVRAIEAAVRYDAWKASGDRDTGVRQDPNRFMPDATPAPESAAPASTSGPTGTSNPKVAAAVDRLQQLAANRSDNVVLVACGAAKQDAPAPARDLYTSGLYRQARSTAQAVGADWFIMSAKHGLVNPDEVLTPYDQTLDGSDTDANRAWAKRVADAVAGSVPEGKRIVILGGSRYRDNLAAELQERGYDVEAPLKGLGVGEQRGAMSRLAPAVDAPSREPAVAGAGSVADDFARLGIERHAPEAVGPEKFPPTQQQQDIIDAVLGGVDVKAQAMAGTGKTTTLEAIARRLETARPDNKVAYIAFNKSVQVEAEGRMPRNVEPRTGHSVAYAWAPKWMQDRTRANDVVRRPDEVAKHLGLGPVKTDAGSPLTATEVAMAVTRMVDTFANSADPKVDATHLPDSLAGLPDGAKKQLVKYAEKAWADLSGKDGRLRLSLDHVRKQWALSEPDFTRPGSGLKRPAKVLFLDEAQDTPPVLAKVIADQKMQKVLVGDENQAIYGFTGAIDFLSTAEADIDLPLTRSWRYGPEVGDIANRFLEVLGARQRVEGSGGPSKIVTGMRDADAILVRSNAGMLNEIAAELENGRTVGVPKGTKKDLESLVESARYLQGVGRAPERLHDDLAEFRTWEEVKIEAAKGNDPKLGMITRMVDRFGVDGLDGLVQQVTEMGDEGLPGVSFRQADVGLIAEGKTFGVKDTLKAAGFRWLEVPGEVEEFGRNKGKPKKAWIATGTPAQQEAKLTAAREAASGGEKPDVVVSTAHKAKGLEWSNVRIGDDFRGPSVDPDTGDKTMPSPEELRLAYVAVTRAENDLDPGSLGWIFDETSDDANGVPGPSDVDVPAPATTPGGAPDLREATNQPGQLDGQQMLDVDGGFELVQEEYAPPAPKTPVRPAQVEGQQSVDDLLADDVAPESEAPEVREDDVAPEAARPGRFEQPVPAGTDLGVTDVDGAPIRAGDQVDVVDQPGTAYTAVGVSEPSALFPDGGLQVRRVTIPTTNGPVAEEMTVPPGNVRPHRPPVVNRTPTGPDVTRRVDDDSPGTYLPGELRVGDVLDYPQERMPRPNGGHPGYDRRELRVAGEPTLTDDGALYRVPVINEFGRPETVFINPNRATPVRQRAAAQDAEDRRGDATEGADAPTTTGEGRLDVPGERRDDGDRDEAGAPGEGVDRTPDDGNDGGDGGTGSPAGESDDRDRDREDDDETERRQSRGRRRKSAEDEIADHLDKAGRDDKDPKLRPPGGRRRDGRGGDGGNGLDGLGLPELPDLPNLPDGSGGDGAGDDGRRRRRGSEPGVGGTGVGAGSFPTIPEAPADPTVGGRVADGPAGGDGSTASAAAERARAAGSWDKLGELLAEVGNDDDAVAAVLAEMDRREASDPAPATAYLGDVDDATVTRLAGEIEGMTAGQDAMLDNAFARIVDAPDDEFDMAVIDAYAAVPTPPSRGELVSLAEAHNDDVFDQLEDRLGGVANRNLNVLEPDPRKWATPVGDAKAPLRPDDVTAMRHGHGLPGLTASRLPEEVTLALWGMTPDELRQRHGTGRVHIPGTKTPDDIGAEMKAERDAMLATADRYAQGLQDGRRDVPATAAARETAFTGDGPAFRPLPVEHLLPGDLIQDPDTGEVRQVVSAHRNGDGVDVVTRGEGGPVRTPVEGTVPVAASNGRELDPAAPLNAPTATAGVTPAGDVLQSNPTRVLPDGDGYGEQMDALQGAHVRAVHAPTGRVLAGPVGRDNDGVTIGGERVDPDDLEEVSVLAGRASIPGPLMRADALPDGARAVAHTPDGDIEGRVRRLPDGGVELVEPGQAEGTPVDGGVPARPFHLVQGPLETPEWGGRPGEWTGVDGGAVVARAPGEWDATIAPRLAGEGHAWSVNAGGAPRQGTAPDLESAKAAVAQQLRDYAEEGGSVSVMPSDRTPSTRQSGMPAEAPGTVGGQPAEWVDVADLSVGDAVRINGIDADGVPATAAGYALSHPSLVTVHRRGGAGPQDMIAVVVGDSLEGDGKRRTMFAVPGSPAARATPNTTGGDMHTPDAAETDVLTGRVRDVIPAGRDGVGLFPGSRVMDPVAGRRGVVVAARAMDVSVRWDDDGSIEDQAGSRLQVAGDAVRTPGWTTSGRRVVSGQVVSMAGQQVTTVNGVRSERVRGTVQSVDGDTVTVLTPAGLKQTTSDQVDVLGGGVDAPTTGATYPVEHVDMPAGMFEPIDGGLVAPTLSRADRDALVALGFDLDQTSDPEVAEAANRLRHAAPISRAQARALQEAVQKARGAADRRSGWGRAMDRLAAALGGAGQGVEQPRQVTVADLTPGDHVVLDGQRVVQVERVNPTSLDVIDEDGTPRRVGFPDEVTLLPSLPNRAPVDAPAPTDVTEELRQESLLAHRTTNIVSTARRLGADAQRAGAAARNEHEYRELVGQALGGDAFEQAQRQTRRQLYADLNASGVTGEDRSRILEQTRPSTTASAERARENILAALNDFETRDGESWPQARARMDDVVARAAAEAARVVAGTAARGDLSRVNADRRLQGQAPVERVDLETAVRDLVDGLEMRGASAQQRAAVEARLRQLGDRHLQEFLRAVMDDLERSLNGPITPEAAEAIIRRAEAMAGRFDRRGRRRAVVGAAAVSGGGVTLQGKSLEFRIGYFLGSLIRKAVELIAKAVRALTRLALDTHQSRDAVRNELNVLRGRERDPNVPRAVDALGLSGTRMWPAGGFGTQTMAGARYRMPATGSRAGGRRTPVVDDSPAPGVDRASDGGPGVAALGHLDGLIEAGGRVHGRSGEGARIAEANRLEQAAIAAERQARDAGPGQDRDLLEHAAATSRALADAAYQRAARDEGSQALAALRAERNMGESVDVRANLAGDADAVASARWALQHFPTDWIRALDGRTITVLKSRDGRGEYDHEQGVLTLADVADTDLPGAGRYGVNALHEWTHVFEAVLPDLGRAQWTYHYDRTSTGRVGARERTGRNAARQLAELDPTVAWGPDEVARADDYPDPYMGREYGDGMTHFELMAMLMESLFGGQRYITPQMRQFALGVLAELGAQGVSKTVADRQVELIR